MAAASGPERTEAEPTAESTPAETVEAEAVEAETIEAAASGRAPLTERQKRILAVALVVHALVVVVTLRDLRRRPPDLVRGPKWLWGLAATVNTSGSAAYWLVGRRRHPRASA